MHAARPVSQALRTNKRRELEREEQQKKSINISKQQGRRNATSATFSSVPFGWSQISLLKPRTFSPSPSQPRIYFFRDSGVFSSVGSAASERGGHRNVRFGERGLERIDCCTRRGQGLSREDGGAAGPIISQRVSPDEGIPAQILRSLGGIPIVIATSAVPVPEDVCRKQPRRKKLTYLPSHHAVNPLSYFRPRTS